MTDKAVERISRYVEICKTKHIAPPSGGTIHLVHAGTKWEAELLFEDLVRLLEIAKAAQSAGESKND